MAEAACLWTTEVGCKPPACLCCFCCGGFLSRASCCGACAWLRCLLACGCEATCALRLSMPVGRFFPFILLF